MLYICGRRWLTLSPRGCVISRCHYPRHNGPRERFAFDWKDQSCNMTLRLTQHFWNSYFWGLTTRLFLIYFSFLWLETKVVRNRWREETNYLQKASEELEVNRARRRHHYTAVNLGCHTHDTTNWTSTSSNINSYFFPSIAFVVQWNYKTVFLIIIHLPPSIALVLIRQKTLVKVFLLGHTWFWFSVQF